MTLYVFLLLFLFVLMFTLARVLATCGIRRSDEAFENTH